MSKVILTYHAQDGTPLANTLRQRLISDMPALEILSDQMATADQVGGWQPIQQQINEADFAIILITPESLASGQVKKVWDAARHNGTALCPVQMMDNLTYPDWLNPNGVFKLDSDWELLKHSLLNPAPIVPVPFMVPDLPEHYIPRRELDTLVDALLDLDRDEPIVLHTNTSLLYGTGLRTLATAACHNPDVQALFDGGIIWLRFGENPNMQAIVSRLNRIISELEGVEVEAEEEPEVDVTTLSDEDDSDFEYADGLALQAVKEHYAQFKPADEHDDDEDEDETYYLLILDDVYNAGHVFPFIRESQAIVASDRLDAIILTHEPAVARNLRAVTIPAQELDPQDAVALLSTAFENPPTDELATLAERLGGWTILLDIARGILASREDNALDYLNALLTRMGIDQVRLDDLEEAEELLPHMIAAALDHLSSADQMRYRELAIFPEQVAVPLSTLAKLWQLDDALPLTQQLHQLGLLEFNFGLGVIRVHHYLREFLLDELADEAAVHQRLLDAWGDVPPDAYAWRNLAYHLVKAGRREALLPHLLNFDWMQAKLNATDGVALYQDYFFVADNESILHLRDTLANALPALTRDKAQLAEQLLARLPFEETPELDQLLEDAEAKREGIWFFPRSLSLTPPEIFEKEVTRHMPGVYGIACNADHAVTISPTSVAIWSIEDVDTLARVYSPEGVSFNTPALSDQYIFSGTTHGDIALWDFEDVLAGRRAKTEYLKAHRDWINQLVVVDGNLLSICSGGMLAKWDIAGRKLLYLIEPHGGTNVEALAVLPSGTHMVTGGWDGAVSLRTIQDGAEVRRMLRHREPVTAVAVTPDDQFIISGDAEGVLHIWLAGTGAHDRTIQHGEEQITALEVTPDGKRFIVADARGDLSLYELASGQKLTTLTADNRLTDATLTPDGTQVIAADNRGYVHFLRIRE